MEGINNQNFDPVKKKEADSEYKKGKKAVGTGLFKWSPDHLSASFHFENAAKLYKEIGNDVMARDSFTRYAQASEKTDSLSSAADGYTQAAFLEDDFKKSEQLLKKAQQLYMIEGKGERGLMNLKKYVQQQLDVYEDLSPSKQSQQTLTRISNLYKSLYHQVFATEDNFLFNQDLIDTYLNFLVGKDLFFEAIEARQTFIKYLVKQKTIDHQIRRAYLEICCLHIVGDDKFGLKKALDQFCTSVPDAMRHDEFKIGEKLQ